MRIYSIRRACCSSIHRIGFVHIVQIEYEELYLRFERWSRRKGLSTHTHTYISIYIYLISRLNETFQNLLHPPPSRKRNKTDTLLIVLPRRGERTWGEGEREGYVQGGRVMRGRKRRRRKGEEGGKLAAPSSFRFPASVAYNSRGPVMFHATQ